MVKKSKKSKSKRVPLRKKYKIIKKVKEHHKKKAKEAKKQIGKKKPKVEKDPGIPNAWPFKEQELKALEERRARVLKELEEKKLAKKLRAKERAELRKRGVPEKNELDDLVRDTETRTAQFERASRNKTSSSSSQDGSKRAFYKELLKVIEASDVIIEVLDARDPLGTRCPDMERLVFKSQTSKRLVLLLNKIDLVPKEIAEKWLKYLREELPTVAFKCNTQMQRSNLSRKKSKSKVILETSSDCLGADTLLQLLKNYSRSDELKRAITVGIVGLPNVGKSSLINSLKRSRAVSAGGTPGLTRTMQEVQLDKHVKLLDCPGVVLASATDSKPLMDLRNCTRIEKLADPVAPVKEIVSKCGHEKLMSFYKIPSFSTVDEFLQLVATIRGKFKKGGVVDTETAARIVLHDWNEGKISHYTVPPVREPAGPSESAIVTSWGKEFNVDEVFKREQSTVIAGLPCLSDADHTELPAGAPMSMDVTMMENSDDEDEKINEEGDGVAESQAMDTAELPARKEKQGVQTEKLYDEEGIFNPRLAKAEKRRRKKSTKEAAAMEGTYDFDVDYVDSAPLKKKQQKNQSKSKQKTRSDMEI
ncbi:guanine nucleotide-binding protein-like NSN1 [Selaginella moellendorffii]|uniref:guanine nucleotide-binding protein-like NSN1 n=1 Tax=Selaginella moellendorffii TaxID=88036 RepID=UPI000D1D05C0|nr:guanine nucleotide-binding protein-like NSN1 [Selaginella moellendorffii]|eukprot:XP_024533646.1 guanine nucleotide-binding protein-like NSN1 [Selaginella moellendorffii]